jgi:hypothetical protein
VIGGFRRRILPEVDMSKCCKDEDPAIGQVHYVIDAEDKLIDLGKTWDDFALANDGEAVVSAEVVGRSLWDFIFDESTALLYKSLLTRLRATGNPIRFPFRCDSPDLRRHLVMTLSPLQNGNVEFRNSIVELEPREAKAFFQAAVAGAKEYFYMCSVCNKVRSRSSRDWKEVEDAFETHISSCEHPVQVLYKVCRHCARRIEEEHKAFRSAT